MSKRNVTRTDTTKTSTVTVGTNVEYERFRSLTKNLLGVPKSELDKQRDNQTNR